MLVAVPAFHRTVVNETWENIVVRINSVLAFYLNEALIFFMSSWILENFLSLSNFQEIAECETIPETTTVQTTDVSTTTVTTTDVPTTTSTTTDVPTTTVTTTDVPTTTIG